MPHTSCLLLAHVLIVPLFVLLELSLQAVLYSRKVKWGPGYFPFSCGLCLEAISLKLHKGIHVSFSKLYFFCSEHLANVLSIRKHRNLPL